MKSFVDKYSDKIAFVLAVFNLAVNTFHTKYGTLYSYLFKNLNGIITACIFVICYFLAKRTDTIYSRVALGVIYLYLVTVFISPLIMAPFMF